MNENLIERNRAVMRRFETCINTNDIDLAKELISEKAAFKTPVSPTPLMGAEGYMSVVTMMRSSFPDVQWKLKDMGRSARPSSAGRTSAATARRRRV